MTHEKFEALMKELDSNSLDTLLKKNAAYAPGDDALHNFNAGGEVLGGTPAQACWGYLTKHLVALRDKVQNNDFHNREDLLEKCQDSINYIRFLWCIANEEMEKYTAREGDAPEALYTDAYYREKAAYEAHIAGMSCSCHGHGGAEA